MRELTIIKNKIFEIRGQRVMLDFDLAELYEVETRTAKTCRKTQYDTLSTDFMFELIEEDAVL